MLYYFVFLAVDLGSAALAFLLDRKENLKLLPLLVLQRLGYRQLMYYVDSQGVVRRVVRTAGRVEQARSEEYGDARADLVGIVDQARCDLRLRDKTQKGRRMQSAALLGERYEQVLVDASHFMWAFSQADFVFGASAARVGVIKLTARPTATSAATTFFMEASPRVMTTAQLPFAVAPLRYARSPTLTLRPSIAGTKNCCGKMRYCLRDASVRRYCFTSYPLAFMHAA